MQAWDSGWGNDTTDAFNRFFGGQERRRVGKGGREGEREMDRERRKCVEFKFSRLSPFSKDNDPHIIVCREQDCPS